MERGGGGVGRGGRPVVFLSIVLAVGGGEREKRREKGGKGKASMQLIGASPSPSALGEEGKIFREKKEEKETRAPPVFPAWTFGEFP